MPARRMGETLPPARLYENRFAPGLGTLLRADVVRPEGGEVVRSVLLIETVARLRGAVFKGKNSAGSAGLVSARSGALSLQVRAWGPRSSISSSLGSSFLKASSMSAKGMEQDPPIL